MRRYAWLFAALAMAVGCQSLLGVRNPLGMGGCGDSPRPLEPRAVLDIRLIDSPVDSASATAVGDAGKIVISGRLNTPDPCFKFGASVGSDGQSLTVSVGARRNSSEACIAMITSWGYECVVYGLKPGAYDLKVLNAFPHTDRATTAFSGPVTVR
jgi:hypothetical protein